MESISAYFWRPYSSYYPKLWENSVILNPYNLNDKAQSLILNLNGIEYHITQGLGSLKRVCYDYESVVPRPDF